MKQIIRIILWILSFLCFYAILNIGLGKLWTIGYSENYEKINNVLINLSYSYIAGLIFYIFVSYLPNKIRIEKFKPIIKRKVDNLYNQINGCVVTFQSATDGDLIHNINLESLTRLIVGNSLYSISYYGNLTGISMDNFLFLNSTRSKVFELLESLLQYRDFMTNETVTIIEDIKDAKYFHLIKRYETTPTMKLMYDHAKYKEEISKELYQVIELVKVLKYK